MCFNHSIKYERGNDDMARKRIWLLLGIILLSFSGADAITKDDIEYDESNVIVSEKDGVYTLKLTGDASENFEVKTGEKIILDLNGYTFTNLIEEESVIKIENGGELTIVDSSMEKDGIIMVSDNFDSESPVINNAGVLVINSGIIRVNDSKRMGIYNLGELTFDGGVIENTKDATWGITNTGKIINDGDFIQGATSSIILNEKDMEINGGNFESMGNFEHETLITNRGLGNAKIIITDGEFNSNEIMSNDDEDEILIIGGSYSNDISKYVKNGYSYYNGSVVKNINVTFENIGTFDEEPFGITIRELAEKVYGSEINKTINKVDFVEFKDENGNVIGLDVPLQKDIDLVASYKEEIINPRTGDNLVLCMNSLLIGVMGLIGTIILRKKV